MIQSYFHCKKTGAEFYVFRQLENKMYVAQCTKASKIYKVGEIKTFFFDDIEIWTPGKLQPNNHSLTILKGNQR